MSEPVNGSGPQPTDPVPPKDAKPPELTDLDKDFLREERKQRIQLANDFLREEHKQRRQEIVDFAARREADARNAILITGAIWSWLATHQVGHHLFFEKIIAFVPAILMVFLWYRGREMSKVIHVNAKYIRELETRSGAAPLWEMWLEIERGKGIMVTSFRSPHVILWQWLILLNFLLAALFALPRSWFGG